MALKSRKIDKSFAFAALLVFLDQASKLAIKGFSIGGFRFAGLSAKDSVKIIGDTLTLTLVENPGMAFGLSFGAAKILLSLFSLGASIVLAIYLYRLSKFSIFVRAGVSFILAGAFGNFIDRTFYGIFYGYAPLFYGKVVDFIQVDIPDINVFGYKMDYWPVFNLADSYVTIGAILLLIFYKKIPPLKSLK